MKNLCIAVLALIISQSAFAQYDPEAKMVLESMSKLYKSKPAFTADFTQNLTNESAGLNETIKGTIHVKDNMYKLEIAGQEVYNNGEAIYSFNKEANEATITAVDPDEQEISLSNIWDLYKSGYKYGMNENDAQGNQVVDLEPEDRSSTSYFKIRMIISQKNELLSFSVFENTGNKYEYVIDKFKDRGDLTDADFKFDPLDYPGVELIDFR